MWDDSGRIPDRRAFRRDITDYDGSGSDHGIVADSDWPEDLRPAPYIYPVAEYGSSISRFTAPPNSNRHALLEATVGTDNCPLVHHQCNWMLQAQSRSNLGAPRQLDAQKPIYENLIDYPNRSAEKSGPGLTPTTQAG